jgi:serine/threonine protein kinase
VLELCDASLDDYGKGKYQGPIPNAIDWLTQMTEGLNYIHSRNLVHRDIKPANILISTAETSTVLKIADFGLSKPTTDRGSYSISNSSGTANYWPPEYLKLEPWKIEELKKIRGNVASDVFAMGCVFYFFLTKGQHPFGQEYFIPDNIIKGKYVFNSKARKVPSNIKYLFEKSFELSDIELSIDCTMMYLIVQMTHIHSESRPAMSLVLDYLKDPDHQCMILHQDAFLLRGSGLDIVEPAPTPTTSWENRIPVN